MLALGAAACGGGGGATPAAPSGASGSAASSSGQSARAKPNFVFIMADDLDVEAIQHMYKLKPLMIDQGVTFANSFAATPICCPSRASMLTGRYSHNHGIWGNGRGANTCFEQFQRSGQEGSTVATWLKAAGYKTGLFGKYLNLYPGGGPNADNTYVPPGWDEWHAVFSSQGSDAYYDYFINENQKVVPYGNRSADYLTDVLVEKAAEFIKKSAGAPFFVWFAPNAPHNPAMPARRHENHYAGRGAPRGPAFNEEDMSDKPRYYREQPRLSSADIAEVDYLYRRRLETMLAVDDGIETLIQALHSVTQLENTYVIFASDNGFLLGQHRFPNGKAAPYEESIRTPLIVRGPGVPAGRSLSHDVANIDLAPTLAELAQASAADVDGRSFAALLGQSPPSTDTWRKDLLLEHELTTGGDGLPSWAAVRTKDYIFIEYASQSELEYYDLVNDPYQLQSRHGGLDAERRRTLTARLRQLQECRGASCRSNP
jgi:arylsulfatase A-like enzyme